MLSVTWEFLKAVRKLKRVDGHYLWQPADDLLAGGGTIAGLPFQIVAGNEMTPAEKHVLEFLSKRPTLRNARIVVDALDQPNPVRVPWRTCDWIGLRLPMFDTSAFHENVMRIHDGRQLADWRASRDEQGWWTLTVLFRPAKGGVIDDKGKVIRTAEEVYGVADFDVMFRSLEPFELIDPPQPELVSADGRRTLPDLDADEPLTVERK